MDRLNGTSAETNQLQVYDCWVKMEPTPRQINFKSRAVGWRWNQPRDKSTSSLGLLGEDAILERFI